MTHEKLNNKKVLLGSRTIQKNLQLELYANFPNRSSLTCKFEGEIKKMQTVQQLQHFTNGNNTRSLSSFELMANWIDIAYKLELSSTAIQVMTVLLRFYNPLKKYVFPHQSTIAERTNTSIATVKRSLNELIKARLIIKTRTQKGNVYGFTPKLFELCDSSICTISTAQNEPCIQEQIKRTDKRTSTARKAEKPKSKNDVVVSFNSLSLKCVPASILTKKTDRNGKPIRSHAAYWNSLTDEQKCEYLKAEEVEAEKLKKREELKKQQKAEKERERAEAEARKKELEKPLNEQFSRKQAIKHVWGLRKLHRGIMKPGLTKSLVELYNLDVVSICAMSEEELKNIL